MAFKMKYKIESDYLAKGSNKRPGNHINVRFIVSHDTGNPGSTAAGNVSYYKRVQYQTPASAQLFVDDERILECIPALLGTPERAYHVIYNVTTDNAIYGDDANDVAIGVELCFGKGIDSKKAYAKYVFTLAYLCYKYKLDPKRDIIGHDKLDPKRKIDPTNGLKYMGKTFTQLITDVVAEYKACTNGAATPNAQVPSVKVGTTHKVVAGETLYGIAKKFDKTVAQLKVLNPEIDINALHIGQVLLISAAAPAPKPTPAKPKLADQLAEYLKYKPIRPYPGKAVGLDGTKFINKGGDVEAIQRALKLSVDGKFGPLTAKAVKAYQTKFPFLGTPDGIVGINTWNVMF